MGGPTRSSTSASLLREPGRLTPSPPLRILTSSVFGFVVFTLYGAGVSQYAARQIVGTDRGIVFYVIEVAGWSLAAFAGGFVAGYRSPGKGWGAGLLVGLFTDLSLIALIAFLASTGKPASFDLLVRAARSHPAEFLAALLLMLSVLPAGMLGGRYGSIIYRDHGRIEDPRRRTLFGIPWWHWLWLLPILPPVAVSDLLVSGHLLALGIAVAILSSIRVSFPPLVAGAGVIGSLFVISGAAMLWQGLSVSTDLNVWKRVGATILGLVLLVFGVNILWAVASPLLLATIRQLLT